MRWQHVSSRRTQGSGRPRFGGLAVASGLALALAATSSTMAVRAAQDPDAARAVSARPFSSKAVGFAESLPRPLWRVT